MEAAAPASIDDYIAAQVPAVQPVLQKIRVIKNHIGIYPPVRGDAALLEALARYRGEKGNLCFPLAEAMPYELIRRVARQRVKENAARSSARGGSAK